MFEIETNPWFENGLLKNPCIQTGHNGRFVTMHDPTMDIFLKFDRNPQGSWLRQEANLIKASVSLIHPEMTEEALNEKVSLFEMPTLIGQPTLGLQTARLGVSVSDAFKNGIVKIDDIPLLSRQLLETADTLFSRTGFFNKDLNPANILLDESNRGLVIIDWYKHVTKAGGNLSTFTAATAIAKFLKPFLRFGLSKDQILGAVQSDQYLEVLAFIEDRQII